MAWFQYFRALQRISKLEECVESLTRIVEARDLDWVDMKARCKRLLDRTTKAADRIDSEAELELEAPAAVNGESVAGLVHHALTPRQRAVQSNILRQRMNRR